MFRLDLTWVSIPGKRGELLSGRVPEQALE